MISYRLIRISTALPGLAAATWYAGVAEVAPRVVMYCSKRRRFGLGMGKYSFSSGTMILASQAAEKYGP
jgi:hypothetical protein